MNSNHGPIRESIESLTRFRLEKLAKIDPTLFDYLELLDLIEIKSNDRMMPSKLDKKEKAFIENHFVACNRCGESLPVASFPHYEKGSKICATCINDRFWSKRSRHPRIDTWVRSTMTSHKRGGYRVKITINELTELAERTTHCVFCRDELNWSDPAGSGSGKRFRPSLDRVNNEKILTKDNVMIICQRCNSIKSDMSAKDFIEFCGKVWKNCTGTGMRQYQVQMAYRKQSLERPIKVMGILG